MSAQKKVSDIKACVFDAYGTLLDFNSAVAREHQAIGDKSASLSELWRRKQLEYTWLRSLMRRHADFYTVTGEALDFSLECFGIDDNDLRARLMASYNSLDPYPEVPDMLKALKSQNIQTAILSNGSPEMLDAGVESAGIAGYLDALLSVEDVGIFKPAPEIYHLATTHFGIAANEVLFMSSNAWDVHGASSSGFRCIWVNRADAPPEHLPNGPEFVLSSLDQLPELVG